MSTSHATLTATPLSRGSKAAVSTAARRASEEGLPSSSRPSASRRRAPSARSIPAPPSFVALPPTPTRRSRAPPSKAARIICPTPKLVASRMRRRSGGIIPNPTAWAHSMTAVPPAMAKRAVARPP